MTSNVFPVSVVSLVKLASILLGKACGMNTTVAFTRLPFEAIVLTTSPTETSLMSTFSPFERVTKASSGKQTFLFSTLTSVNSVGDTDDGEYVIVGTLVGASLAGLHVCGAPVGARVTGLLVGEVDGVKDGLNVTGFVVGDGV